MVMPDKDGDSFVVGFKKIDSIVEAEQRYIQLQNEQLKLIDVLSSEYNTLISFNMKTRKMVLCND